MFPRHLLWTSLLLLALSAAHADPPKPVDPQLVVELVAQEPQIRTPTAIQVDGQGRIWLLENNTHFRPKNYEGPPTDRVLILDQFGADGRAGRVTVFAEGFSNGMGLRLLPGGDAIVSTRAETFRLHDSDGDGRADEKRTLLKLETTDDYPHNGLSGLALGPDGALYVSFGENHGAPWTLTGSDNTVVTGTDEGGVFRCDLEGRGLEHWALGFWNPFGLAFDRAGRLFALDNDPSGGSICRLLHVVHHGDHGYRYRYGRTIDHPFVSWYGERRGTLPPLCLTGEAPTGLLEYRGPALGAGCDGDLLGCTWGDHGIQQFHLEPRGASFSAQPKWFLRGGNDFRPSGIAQAPDGSLAIADWVDGSYEVHGKGRVWRVRRAAAVDPAAAAAPSAAFTLRPPEQELQRLLAGDIPAAQALPTLASDDPYLVHGAIDTLAFRADPPFLAAHAQDADAKVRLGVLLALRRAGRADDQPLFEKWLADSDGAVRRAALQWIGEQRLSAWKDKLEPSLSGEPSSATFQSYLAALQLLATGKPDPKITAVQTAQLALDPARPAELRALALRLTPPASPALPLPQLRGLAAAKELPVRREAVRILAARPDAESQAELRRLAAEPALEPELQAEALAGLALSAGVPETHALLRQALGRPESAVRREALRSLRTFFDEADAAVVANWITPLQSAKPEEAELLRQIAFVRGSALEKWAGAFASAAAPHPAPGEPWPAVLQGGDPAAGRRLFYHPSGPRCFTCHAIEGRGGAVGPDLTQIGKLDPAQLLESIREPSKEIAPAYLQWALTMRDGRIGVGIDLFEDNKSQTILIDATGAKTRYKNDDVLTREPLPVSLMPPGLDFLMTEQEFRDLLSYLREKRD